MKTLYKNPEKRKLYMYNYQKNWREKNREKMRIYHREYMRKRRKLIPEHCQGLDRKMEYRRLGIGGYGNINKPKKFATREERIKNWSNLSKERRKNNPYNSQLIAYERIEKEIPELEKQGFRCFPITKIIPDIIALKDGKIYAIEIEYGHMSRINNKKIRYGEYPYKFDDVIWIKREK